MACWGCGILLLCQVVALAIMNARRRFPMSDDAFGPGDMLDEYQNVRVPTGEGYVILKVDNYRNLSRGAASKGGCDDAIKVKDALVQVASSSVWSRAGGPVGYMNVFSGKGSPGAIGGVMAAFYDYADKFIRTFPPNKNTPVGRCSMWMADDNLSWQDALQNICHEFIGLDCNGFVGNWLKRCDHSLKLTQDSKPKIVYDQKRVAREDVKDIEYWDIVIWADFSHIAAVLGEGGGGKPRFYICQSAGGGPRCNLYEINRVSSGVFQLRGGIPEKDVPGNVYVISPWGA
jgi:hypothetical protein